MKTTIRRHAFITLFWMVAAYVVISPAVQAYVGDGLHLMLAWNMVLAFVPIAILYAFRNHVGRHPWITGGIFMLWLLFYPNSVYIVTDLIYVDSAAFIHAASPYAPYVYLESLDAYVALFHIFIGAMLGLMLGLLGLNVWYERIRGPWKIPFLAAVFVLSGIAVYIGRFLRYNSWDIVRSFSILTDMIERFDGFMVYFILGYVILQAVAFFLFRLVFAGGNKPI